MNRANEVLENVDKVILGKRNITELILASLLAGGHVLIEDVPGVGKTQLVMAISASVNGKVGRIQFTPDVMPGDIIGYTMIDPKTGDEFFRKGAAFCNFLIADEINRASPKTQSALLEIMEENSVSVGAMRYALPQPFMVLATENPVETYGTYHLPEAQMDRFLMKISIGYPSEQEEIKILDNNSQGISARSLSSIVSTDDVMEMRKEANEVFASDALKKYIISIVENTRKSNYIQMGVSPRGSIALFRAVKSFAYVKGRNYCLPDDVKTLAVSVLSHRIILSHEGKSIVKTPEQAIERIINETKIPIETK